MAEPFIAEIRIMPYNFAPKGWAFCDGQILNISQNQALFALIGSTYGGNGRTTMALPNLQGRVPTHPSVNVSEGQNGGTASVSLSASQLPAHGHNLQCNPNRSSGNEPQNGLLGRTRGFLPYSDQQGNTSMATEVIGVEGGSAGHENRQPYLALNFFIALQGVFPSRN